MKKIVCLLLSMCIILSIPFAVFAIGAINNGRDKSVGRGTATERDCTLTEVRYYIQINGEQMDKYGNTSSQSKSLFTDCVHTTTFKLAPELAAARYMSIGEGENGEVVTEDDILALMTEAPSNDAAFEAVKDSYYNRGYLKANTGDVIPWSQLGDELFRVEWYTLKIEDDGWHVDGRIIDRSTDEPITIVVPSTPEDIPPETYEEPAEEPTEASVAIPSYSEPYELTNDYAYIFGRNDAFMEPEDGMKRGEVASVLYRLLKQNDKLGDFIYDASNEPLFASLAGRWDRSALEFMAYLGVYDASADDLDGEEKITRGEAFKMMAIALGFTTRTDLSETEYALVLEDYGAIQGDNASDTSIANLHLDRVIKRAEMCKIYNIIIERDENDLVTADGTEVTANTYGFVDVPSDAWYYGDILRATSAFTDGYVDLEARGIRNVLDDYTN